MRAEIYWITDWLAIMPRPRGGDWLEDEVESLKQQGVTTVVSLLERDEIIELELREEESFCDKCGLKFLSFPIPDRQVPASAEKTVIFIEKLQNLLNQKERIAVHCRQGVGRSSLIAACIMVNNSNASVDKAFAQISEARKCVVPDTPEQREWVNNLSSINEHSDELVN